MTINAYTPAQGYYCAPTYNPFNPAQQKFNAYVHDISVFNQSCNDLSLYNNTGFFVPSVSNETNTNSTNDTTQNNTDAAPTQAPEEEQEELGFLGGIGRIIGAPFKYGWEIIKSGGKFIANVASGAWKATGGAIGTLLSGHPIDALCEVFEGIGDVVASPFKLVGDLASDTVNYVKDTVGGAGNIIQGAWNGVKDFFKGLF